MDSIIDTMKNIDNDSDDSFMLPGFRFHPTDEELVGFYLKRKIMHKPLSIELIKQLDIYKYDPWDLPKMATTGEKEWYFYCPRDRKYRNSARPNRVTVAGFWKATGTDRPIYSSEGAARCIGLKKSLVFYRGRAAKGIKTDWMMHEFRLPGSVAAKKYLDKNIPANEAWAICRIFKKANSGTQRALSNSWASTSPMLHDMHSTASDIHTINPFVNSNPAVIFPQCRPIYDHTRSFVDKFTVIPESYNIDASALLQDMSTSVFGEVFSDELNGFSTENAVCGLVEEAKEKIENEWGMIRPAMECSSYCNLSEGYWNKANPMWDYPSPSCPSELSSAYPTNN